MTLESYKLRLEKHDWYFSSSEDPRWYSSGLAEEKELLQLASERTEFMDAYNEVKHKYFSQTNETKT